MAQGPAGLRASASCRKTRSGGKDMPSLHTDRAASLMPTTETPRGTLHIPHSLSQQRSLGKTIRSFLRRTRRTRTAVWSQCFSPSVPQFQAPKVTPSHPGPAPPGSSKNSWAGKPLVSRSAPSVTTECASQEVTTKFVTFHR